MKVRNISNQDLKISLQVNNEIKSVTVRPNQVMYCEDKSQINKQLLIYEKKKLVNIEKQVEKPDYVEHYKSFFESGTYSTIKPADTIDIDDDIEMSEMQEGELEPERFEEIDIDEIDDEVNESVKKGRGRPKKVVIESATPSEKKGRGRPKGSTKSKEV